jgi:hypothetical protein
MGKETNEACVEKFRKAATGIFDMVSNNARFIRMDGSNEGFLVFLLFLEG